MKSMTLLCCILISMLCRPESALGAEASPTDKTLISWVTLDNTSQRGGSVLTIQQGGQFDGIVFGEIRGGKWMAGSNGFARTEQAQDGNAAETADSSRLIQMAIVYKDNRISIYRNGEGYASYGGENIDLLSPKDNVAVFGLRHVGASILDGRISGAMNLGDILPDSCLPRNRPFYRIQTTW